MAETLPPSAKVCSVAGCGKRVQGRGLCSTHYSRWWKYGDPLSTIHASPLDPPEQRLWARVARGAPDECWEWQGSRSRDGYGQFCHSRKVHLAHRFAYLYTFGDIPEGMSVLHRCDNRACCNPAHLFLGTQQDNIEDMLQKGRYRSGMARLDADKVRDVRARYAAGEKIGDIAKSYGLHHETIRGVVRGLTWQDVPGGRTS